MSGGQYVLDKDHLYEEGHLGYLKEEARHYALYTLGRFESESQVYWLIALIIMRGIVRDPWRLDGTTPYFLLGCSQGFDRGRINSSRRRNYSGQHALTLGGTF